MNLGWGFGGVGGVGVFPAIRSDLGISKFENAFPG